MLGAADLRAGQHIAALGADAHGKAELERDALRRCHLFCDEWEQASGGGELSGAVAAGEVSRGQVTQLGEVLTGDAKGRGSDDETTLFDSTGLAIQDLGICLAVLDAHREGRIEAQAGRALGLRGLGSFRNRQLPVLRIRESRRIAVLRRMRRVARGAGPLSFLRRGKPAGQGFCNECGAALGPPREPAAAAAESVAAPRHRARHAARSRRPTTSPARPTPPPPG